VGQGSPVAVHLHSKMSSIIAREGSGKPGAAPSPQPV
jgi:hypothetical protein